MEAKNAPYNDSSAEAFWQPDIAKTLLFDWIVYIHS
jgi:hypothetical protein